MTNQAIFTPLFTASAGFFLYSCCRRLRLIRLGQSENRLDNPAARFRRMLLFVFGQKRVVSKPFGINHFVIFWAFMILLIANGSFILEGIIAGFEWGAFLPIPLYHGLLLAFDLVSFLALAAVVVAFTRRSFFKPDYLDSKYVKARSFEGFLILGFIGLLMVAFFGLNGVRICAGELPAGFMPVSAAVSSMLQSASGCVNCADCNLAGLGTFFWWLHGLILLAFMCFLPLGKHMHILTAIPNCYFQSLSRPLMLPRETFVLGNSFGVAKASDFTWKDLFDSFSCTECGRCQDACPAVNTGKSLNPRQVIHTLKTNLCLNDSSLMKGANRTVPLIGTEGEATNTEETLWACTTCGACLEQCPVAIEQMPKIIKMRRHLVQMESRFPAELLNLFENMEQRSNPWGIAAAERTKWQSTMEVKPFVAGETDYLFYVGCAGAFDSRNKQVTAAMATILNAAGVSWGTLGKEEKCCGDSVRRLGNEYVFEKMARENVQFLKDRGVTKVVTQCPHCFTTLKNDYRPYGLELEVIHHTQLIQELLSSGRLKPTRQVKEMGAVLFHDSCYLGRHNDVYQAPRQVIAAVTGTAAGEFDRHGSESFCCGAGGGRMWMEEHSGERINIARVKEALRKNPDTICVACPYCMTMFEDGLKDCRADVTKVRDIAEVVADGLRPTPA